MDKTSKGLWYFAHPYTATDAEGNYVPAAEDANFALANMRAGELMKRGYNLYSPISHTHPIHKATPDFLKRHEHDMWYHLDNEFIKETNFLGIILAPGWEHSKGCLAELDLFKKQNKPARHYDNCLSGIYDRKR